MESPVELFCANKLCVHHVLIHGTGRMYYRPHDGAEAVPIRRMKIVSTEEKKSFDFCEVCANVLAIVHGKQKYDN